MKKSGAVLQKKLRRRRRSKLSLLVFLAVALIFALQIPIFAIEGQSNAKEDAMPEEYEDFIASLPDDVKDALPENAFDSDVESVSEAAEMMIGIPYLISTLLDAFGSSISSLFPTFAVLCGIVILSATCRAIASSTSGGLSGAVNLASRLCTYGTVAVVTFGSLGHISEYFDSLFAAVASFVPLSGVLMAAGGNVNGAAQGAVTLSATLTVCQFFFSETVMPVFSLCMSLTMLTAFEESGGFIGRSLSSTLKKWYTTALSFVMMVLTVAVTAQNIISAKADGAAMRGVKFVAGSFIPISGGTVSGTLGTLAASVELIRGSVGVIGIAVILLMLLPVVVELAAIRGMYALCGFLAGMLGCNSEKALLDEIGSLYGYLEGISALSAVVFIIALALFAASGAAVVS